MKKILLFISLLILSAPSYAQGHSAVITFSAPSDAIVGETYNVYRAPIRMTPGTAPGTNGTITLTFTGTFTGATGTTPSCSLDIANTGSGTWNLAAVSQLNTRSTTAPVFLWNNTLALTAASTYDVDYVCVPR